jgi:hypothetical protein
LSLPICRTPKPKQFGWIAMIIRAIGKERFGSAGCSVSYRIKPTYVGIEELN